MPVPRLAYPGSAEALLGDDLGPWPIDSTPELAELLRIDRYAELGVDYVRSLVPDLWPF